jgi:ferredoxin/flavodoxin
MRGELKMSFCIAYISPNGATAKVAGALVDQLSKNGASVTVSDLSQAGADRSLIDGLKADAKAWLVIGSPVYRDVAVPPVMAFIDALPMSDKGWAVPFVTYGRACSGVALWQMAKALQARGYRIAGAAKVVALHAMMWQSDHPEGAGHPDAEDLRQVRQLADTLLAQFSSGHPADISLEELDYQPDELAREFKAKIGQPWMVVPKTVDQGACTQCGICVEHCPPAAISLDPTPVFSDGCFDCFNCIRLCPEKAIIPAVPMAKIEAMIRGRVKSIDEQPLTRIFRPREETP